MMTKYCSKSKLENFQIPDLIWKLNFISVLGSNTARDMGFWSGFPLLIIIIIVVNL